MKLRKGWRTARTMSGCPGLRSTFLSFGMMAEGTISATPRDDLTHSVPKSCHSTGAGILLHPLGRIGNRSVRERSRARGWVREAS